MTADPKTTQTARLIAVDWGTTNFRASLLDADGAVVDRTQAARGILHVERDGFGTALDELLGHWLADLPEVPLLMAGMVGSADGLREVPYLPCPASVDDIVNALVRVDDLGLGRAAYIVPGLSGRSVADNPDVMRGEEIQILGALDDGDTPGERIVCLPGTHSKWVTLAGRQVRGFSTAMTGDAFSALRGHTLLKRFAADGGTDNAAFDRGLAQADRPGGLLHHLFSARTEVLLGDLPADRAGAYLSGLLIGDEVRAMTDALAPAAPVTLIGNGTLNDLYARALDARGFATRTIDGDIAAVRGLHHLARHAAL
ncbi:2-dehydro-3-deoxygalactonokinase [Marinobacter sp. JSM 1782161]|uniref:2-dehydro-3-deoxygalactonokinase n=1 Tax=Marinobacter sp. JSM 1782161 TaxID=2685906 RepID=UPI0014024A2B|nr:2-dehydro-3-deoxygalactonokinase [Marinobacter sp. JSM 1782161]